MRVTQSRQKSYADKRRRPPEFEAGDHVFLKVTPTVGIGRAIKSRKLTPRFIWTISNLEEDRNRGLRDCPATTPSELAQCISCFSVEEIHSKPFTCARIR